MRFTPGALAFTVIALAAASSSSAARIYYWTPAHATAAVMAQAKTPLCKVFPNEPSYCQAGRPLPGQEGRVAVGHAGGCTGEARFARAGRYSRFLCDLEGANQVGHWRLEVFTAGPTAIRWKLSQ